MIYVDTSALLKLVKSEESGAAALQEYLEAAGRHTLVSSALIAVEARRGILRTNPRRLPRIDVLLVDVHLVAISDVVIEEAGRLPDPLPTLDAIHLATALLLRRDITALLTYDTRLATAALAHDLTVATPT